MPKRSRLQIYFDVLIAVSEGETIQTRIMYRSNLSWKRIQQILVTLLDQGYVQMDDEKNAKRYRITERGLRALQYYVRAVEDVIKEPIP